MLESIFRLGSYMESIEGKI
jgi:hypothetical protein